MSRVSGRVSEGPLVSVRRAHAGRASGHTSISLTTHQARRPAVQTHTGSSSSSSSRPEASMPLKLQRSGSRQQQQQRQRQQQQQQTGSWQAVKTAAQFRQRQRRRQWRQSNAVTSVCRRRPSVPPLSPAPEPVAEPHAPVRAQHLAASPGRSSRCYSASRPCRPCGDHPEWSLGMLGG